MVNWNKIGLIAIGLGGFTLLVEGVDFLNSWFGAMVGAILDIPLFGLATVRGILGLLIVFGWWMLWKKG